MTKKISSMNPIEKFLNSLRDLFWLRKKSVPKYTKCLTHRTWIDRQVQEEMLKRESEATLKSKENEWFSKYL